MNNDIQTDVTQLFELILMMFTLDVIRENRIKKLDKEIKK